MTSSSDVAGFAELVDATRNQTAALLGSTIAYSPDDWAESSRFPGWTRSHLAAHLVENARAMTRLCKGLEEGRLQGLYLDDASKHLAIEIGALASPLTLQIDLDTTASELQAQFSALENSNRTVALGPSFAIPACQLPLARLSEVVLHHFDLTGLRPDISGPVLEALLGFQLRRDGDRTSLPPVLLMADEGFSARAGGDGDTSTVMGPGVDLLLWLARDIDSPAISGLTTERDSPARH